ncbi:Similar to Carboxypeptidase Y inhibitor; acc. no. P14306 [Pyronema omphalodes CBS 100304]|uniref:Similar to Carboxypeptidase Y inhibitor acc. no. P14306 n=1 Tax=Pyronema omphalodes (strain CBS 100304) TaxID=1076935 RepID=U4LDM7_PYROM|nr:Similar to Carboxypeptidase Y inhibitor; acc. no. P14306 [Pyronema omphalodes CBS 100304]
MSLCHNILRNVNSVLLFSSLSRCGVRASISRSPRIVPQIRPLVTLNESLRETFKKHGIIPQVVDDFTPTALLSVTYPKVEVSVGNTISPEDTQDEPVIRVTPAKAKPNGDKPGEPAIYTIVLTDPDAPSRENPKNAEFCHWIQTGLTADDTIFYSKSRALMKYMGPAPPPKTGKHRYVFLLYRGSNKDLQEPKDRVRWGNPEQKKGVTVGVRKWAKEGGLELVGANFFYAQNKEQ